MKEGILSLMLSCLVLVSCQGGPNKVVVGAQSFTEQTILAQMVRQYIEDRTNLRTVIFECGDAYGCAQALYLNHIDLMVGYSGTGLMYSPSRTIRHRGTLKEVRELYGNSDVAWLGSLGYESGYAIVLPKAAAQFYGVSTIAELRKIEGGVRIAISSVYLGRIGDGLSALIRRHGIRLRGEPLIIEDPVARIRELFRQGADVAVVRQLVLPDDPGLTTLRDSLNFFPHYEAAIVARKETLQARPELTPIFDSLTKKIQISEMRRLVSEVQNNGWSPRGVARRFLQDQGLLLSTSKQLTRRPVISIAVKQELKDQFPELTVLAVRATRNAFPNYAVKLLPNADPVLAVAQGEARLAVVGADSFFLDEDTNTFVKRRSEIEAAAVLGSPYLHLLRRNDGSVEEALAGRIGISSFYSENRISKAILQAAEKEETLVDTPDRLIEGITAEDIDAIILFRLPGDAEIRKWIKEHNLTLYELPVIVKKLPPFLQPAYLPAKTYPEQLHAVSTNALQILIAGPAPFQQTSPLVGSPAVAMISRSHPLTLRETGSMQESIAAVKPVETPHPALPSVWLRTVVEGGIQKGPTTGQTLLDTSLNILVILFLGWIVALVVRRPAS